MDNGFPVIISTTEEILTSEARSAALSILSVPANRLTLIPRNLPFMSSAALIEHQSPVLKELLMRITKEEATDGEELLLVTGGQPRGFPLLKTGPKVDSITAQTPTSAAKDDQGYIYLQFPAASKSIFNRHPQPRIVRLNASIAGKLYAGVPADLAAPRH